MTSPGRVPLTDVARAALAALADVRDRPPPWTPLPHQVPPPGDWYGWLLLAGRGAGKTDACARYVVEHVAGPPCLRGDVPHWVGIVAPTLGDAVTACYAGPSGLRAHDPGARLVQSPGGTVVRWPNGSEGKLFGAREPEDVERLRAGGNRCLVWLEELAAWRYLQACWEQVRFGLRVGPRPRWVASTTPKPRPLVKKLALATPADVVVTRASTRDNPHLPADVRRALDEEYGGTQLGRQELDAELLEEDRDALWTREVLDRTRLVAVPPREVIGRVAVGVDPSGGAGEQGIVVVGRAREADLLPYLRLPPPLGDPAPPDLAGRRLGDPPAAAPGAPPAAPPSAGFATARDRAADAHPWHGVVLDDRTCCLPPSGWGRRAVRAALDWDADELVVEVNFGGAMATATLLDACDAEGATLPVREVRASRGKRVRAQPVSATFARGRAHLARPLPELEDQLCTWTEESGFSPDRLDALVWPFWHLRLVSTAARGLGSLGSALAPTSLTGGR